MLAFRRSVAAMVVLLVGWGLLSQSANGIWQDQADQVVAETAQIEQAIVQAKAAAEQGQIDVSLQTVRRALAAGVPAADASLSGPETLSARQNHLMSVRRIHRSLFALVEQWQTMSVDAAVLTETLQAMVLPESLPRAVFRYVSEADPESTETELQERSVGKLWLQSMIRSGRQMECLQALEQRRGFRESTLDADILRLQLGLELRDSRLVEQGLQLLLQGPAGPIDAEQIMVLVELSQRASELVDDSVRGLADQSLLRWVPAGRAVSLTERQRATLRALAIGEAVDSFLVGTADDVAVKWLFVSDWFADGGEGSARDISGIRRLLQHHEQVALLLLRLGLPELAASRLTLLCALQREFSIAGPSELIGRHCRWLRVLSADERYTFLWTQLLREQSIPLSSAGFQWSDESIFEAVRVAGGDAPAGTAWGSLQREASGLPVHPVILLLEAAFQVGQAETLLTSLGELAIQGHWPAMAAQACLLMVLERHEEADRRIEEFFGLPRGSGASAADAEALLLYGMLLTEKHRDEAVHQLLSRERAGVWSSSPANSAALAMALTRGATGLVNVGSGPRPSGSPVLNWFADSAAGLDPAGVPQAGRFSGGLVTRTGGGRGTFCFPWPMSGDFELSCSAVAVSGPPGGIGFDGITVAGMSRADMLRVEPWGNHSPSLRTGLPLLSRVPVRLGVSAQGDWVQLLVDGAVIQRWPRDGQTATVPFVFLELGGAGCTQWSDFRLSGTVQIPREVRLAEAGDLRGWSSRRLQQSQPACRIDLNSGSSGGPTSIMTSNGQAGRKGTDWSWEAGTIRGRRRGELVERTGRMKAGVRNIEFGLLQYLRPLQNGETLRWEFEYLPNEVESGIALGPLVFWVQTGGVHLDWIPETGPDVAQFPQTARLPAGNEIPTGFLQHGWNAGRLQLSDGLAILSVNDRELLRYPIPPNFDTRPGIVHDRARTEARVRGVVLQGDWPAEFRERDLRGLLNPGERVSAGSLPEVTAGPWQEDPAEELAIALTAGETASRLARVDAQAVLEQGLAWVFPQDGALIRWSGAPCPSDRSGVRSGRRPWNGGISEIVVSPLLELVFAAMELQQVSELEKRLPVTEGADVDEDREMFRTLLWIVQDKAEAADRLRALADQFETGVTRRMSSPWSVLAIAQVAADRVSLRADAIRLLRGVMVLPEGLIRWSSGSRECGRSLLSLLEHVVSGPGEGNVGAETLPPLRDWIPLRLSTAAAAGHLPPAVWTQSADGTVQLVSGTQADGLCWPAPLPGDFTMTCTVEPVAGRYPILGYAGVLFADGKSLRAGEASEINEIPWSRTAIFSEISAPSSESVKPRRYRIQRRQRQLTVEVEGHRVLTREISDRAAPWVVVRMPPEPGVRIRLEELMNESPVALDVQLDSGRELSGWREPWFPRATTVDSPLESAETWRSSEAKLVGVRQSKGGGLPRASLLQYLRPLPRRGALSYSFFFERDQRLVHPVIGGQVLILEPESGLREAALHGTRIEISAASAVGGGAALPLRSSDWNQLQINVTEDRAELLLNGQMIGTVVLATGSDRVFGLFHWSDQTGAEVRDLTLTGEWSVP